MRALTIALCLLATPALADVAGVASVIDGDTIEVHGQRIRLHGIDAPESRQLCRRDGKPWQCGKDAANNSFGRDRDVALAMHPTVKPVALVADAIRDCSKRKQIVLDPFAGSGTTVIAAEKTGRRAHVLELDPIYCDTIIRRWQTFTGKRAHHADTNRCFEEVEELRMAETAAEPVADPTDDSPSAGRDP